MGQKIICIGLNKTGTKSLNMAFQQMGFTSNHVNPFSFHKLTQKAIREDRKILHYLDKWDCLQDIWLHHGLIAPLDDSRYWQYDYKLHVLERIEKDYPDTLYVNNTRPFPEWLKSRKRHIENCSGMWRDYNPIHIRREWEIQRKVVNDFRRDKEDRVMDFDISQADYETLSFFCGMEYDGRPFPWKKKERENYKKCT